MKIETTFLHNECSYYITEYYIGFRHVAPRKGDYYECKRYNYNTLVFMLDGEIEFSYNEYIGRRFMKGDLVFIPHASVMYGLALTDASMLVLTYDLAAQSYLSNCELSRRKFSVEGIDKVHYDFKPLQMSEDVILFAESIITYINSDYRCMHLHELKQKELFIIMQYAYTHEEMMEFFYPIIGEDIPFRTKVMKLAHQQLTIGEFAEKLHMSPRNFTRKFNAEFGETVYKWMLKRKVAQVKLRLLLPDVSITDIIEDYRFADDSHFYRFCKTHFGYTSKELLLRLRHQTPHLLHFVCNLHVFVFFAFFSFQI